jgi:hypothetical protein
MDYGYRSISLNKNEKAKVDEIRKIAIEKLYENNPLDFRRYYNIEERFDDMADGKFLTVNNLPVLANHYNRVILLINPDPGQRMTSVFFS